MGMAVASDGKLYVSLFGTGIVRAIDQNGKLAAPLHVAFTAPGALALGPDQSLYVVDYSAHDTTGQGAIRRIRPDSTVQQLSGYALGLFSQMVVDEAGNLYATDPVTATIWRSGPDGWTSYHWWNLPQTTGIQSLPTAITYDITRHALLVGDAGTGTIFRINDVHATPPQGSTLFHQSGLDIRSMTFDYQGRVLIISWERDNGVLSRLSEHGTLVKLAEGFRAPTAVVYHAHKAYVVNSDGLALLTKQPALPFTVDVVDLSANETNAGASTN